MASAPSQGRGDAEDFISICSETTDFERVKIDFPLNGIRVKFLDHFIEENGGESAFYRMTTKDVCVNFIKPLTVKRKASYCELLSTNYPEYINPAKVFIVYAWSSMFLDVYHAIKYHFRNKMNTSIWIDIFSMSQHMDLVDAELETWMALLKFNISRIGNTAIILSPWEYSPIWKRAWCLYEVFCSLESQDCQIEYIMSQKEWQAFQDMFKEDCSAAITQFQSNIDLKESSTTVVDDKLGILYSVARMADHSYFNKQIATLLRNWVIAIVAKLVTLEENPKELFKLKMSLTDLFMANDDFESAEPLFIEILETTIKNKGQGHFDSLTMAATLASNYYQRHSYPLALQVLVLEPYMPL